jgi:uncharacterized protein (DUF1499 family)
MLNFFSLLGFLVAIGGFVGAYTRSFSPTLGIYLILGGIGWIALLALPALLKTLKWGRRDMPAFALYMGFLALALAGGLGYQWYTNPLNDLSTNVIKPPLFTHPVYLFQPKIGAEFLDKNFELNRDYKQELAGIQSINYSDLETITVKAPMIDLQAVIDRTIKAQFPDWKIVLSDPKSLHIEAELENPYLRSIDDLVVEARPSKNNIQVTTVDFRIRNRFPYGDFGLTANRMTQLRQALTPALDEAAAKFANFQKNYAKPVGTNAAPIPTDAKAAGNKAALPAATAAQQTTKVTEPMTEAPGSAADHATETTPTTAEKAPEPEPKPSAPAPTKPASAKSRLTGKLPNSEE